ncbi:RICIN domain-containing protein [Streptomyces sp. STR69]|uniref:RICIN domain-containing protein n=1 Tax=Streptomyces sp. STR69 TaxID=1796942 RepID=UPI0021C6D24A|nr:RICIN domain-containing protein [Streptomyces sp. STR69]
MTASSEDPTAEAATARTDPTDDTSLPLPRRSRGPSAIAEAAAALGPAPGSGPESVPPPPMSAVAAEFAAFTERAPDTGRLGARTDAPAGDGTDRRVDTTATPSRSVPRPVRRRKMLLAAAATGVVLLTGSLLLMDGDDGKGRSAAGTGSDTVRGGGQNEDVTGSSDSASPSGESSALEADSTRQPTPKAGSPASGKNTGDATATTKAGTKNGGATSGSSAPAADSTAAAATGVLIRGHGSGRCIDVTGGNPADHTRLQIWDCSGAARQKWRFVSDGTVRALGKCMDVDGGSRTDGAWIKLVTCNGTGAQRFRLNAAHDLVNLQADKCVDVTDAGTGNGAELQLWSCTGGDNQKWSTG